MYYVRGKGDDVARWWAIDRTDHPPRYSADVYSTIPPRRLSLGNGYSGGLCPSAAAMATDNHDERKSFATLQRRFVVPPGSLL